jgi:glyoxylase-like metal-dependent hydrolase (beta-lactamase superfamily II)
MVHVDSDGAHAVLSADVLHHPFQLLDLSVGHIGDFDAAQAEATRRRLVDTYVDTDTIISPSHFPPPNAGRFVSDGDRFGFSWLESGVHS